MAAVARQQVVSLESSDEILGVRANDTHVFVLCRRVLHAVLVTIWESQMHQSYFSINDLNVINSIVRQSDKDT